MAKETKSMISIALISAISAVLVAAITTYGTIAVSKPEVQRLKTELETKKIANLPIGTIVPSMLQPTEFAKEVGDLDRDKPEWVLADGLKDITNSRYGQLSERTNTPDLRDMFLRGMSDGREVGDYQEDSIKSHSHTITTAGIWHRSFQGENGSPKTAFEEVGPTGFFGEEETRPKNIAVYFYIKIN